MQLDGRYETAASIPEDIESPQGKLLYFYLSVRDGATVDDLCRDLCLDKGSVLSIVATLRERGHVERTECGYEPIRQRRSA